jgi:hypothetical protein
MQIEVLRGPSLEEFTAKVESFKPTFVYLAGPYSGLVDSIKGTVGPITLQGAWGLVRMGLLGQGWQQRMQ